MGVTKQQLRASGFCPRVGLDEKRSRITGRSFGVRPLYFTPTRRYTILVDGRQVKSVPSCRRPFTGIFVRHDKVPCSSILPSLAKECIACSHRPGGEVLLSSVDGIASSRCPESVVGPSLRIRSMGLHESISYKV